MNEPVVLQSPTRCTLMANIFAANRGHTVEEWEAVIMQAQTEGALQGMETLATDGDNKESQGLFVWIKRWFNRSNSPYPWLKEVSW